MQITNFKQANTELFKFVPLKGGITKVYTLDRIKKLLNYIDNPQDKYKTIHVAGTSGKTSTCYFIASLLKTQGKKVGLTVSPHIEEINERVQINLCPIKEQIFCERLNKFLGIVNESKIKPTYFELLIAFAFWNFAVEKVDYAVIEVGLGGMFDGTNVISRPDKICVITDIGLDHTHILGDTLAKIAAQKAGIILPGNQIFSYIQDKQIHSVIEHKCAIESAFFNQVKFPKNNNLPKNLPEFQKRNWFLALQVFEYLSKANFFKKLSPVQILEASNITIPARMEEFKKNSKTIILDGAHNSQKIAALVSSIKKRYKNQKVAVLISMKDSPEFSGRSDLSVLKSITSRIIITSFKSDQDNHFVSVAPEILAKQCKSIGFENVEIISNPEQAFDVLLHKPEKVLLVTGSFYLMKDVRPLLFATL